MKPGKPDSVFVNRFNRGYKYVFVAVSIPHDWLGPVEVQHPADIAKLLNEWRAAFEREHGR